MTVAPRSMQRRIARAEGDLWRGAEARKIDLGEERGQWVSGRFVRLGAVLLEDAQHFEHSDEQRRAHDGHHPGQHDPAA